MLFHNHSVRADVQTCQKVLFSRIELPPKFISPRATATTTLLDFIIVVVLLLNIFIHQSGTMIWIVVLLTNDYCRHW